ncbi:MAG: helix-turn-helix transcriptional regulator [Deltaproteobacteria bacterium]|nr:helix-turn-helix transcriptional regulator [Deltaproteobacteria bacterium]
MSVFARVTPALSAEYDRRAHLGGPCSTISQTTRDLPHDHALLARHLDPIGISDAIGLTAADGTGAGCLICAPLPRETSISSQEAAVWARVAAHIAAGYRLQRLVAAQTDPEPFADAEAILDAAGRLHDATEPAQGKASREALRAAAVTVTRACGRLRREDPDEAVGVWRALVAGRWSLVDHFDHDGRRFLIARRNDPQSRAPVDLTLRERQVLGYACLGHSNKLIAYELGLSPTTVSTHLARSAAKLGADSRAALIRLAMASGRSGTGQAGRESGTGVSSI